MCSSDLGRDIAHYDFDRDNLHLSHQLLTHVEPLDEVVRNADMPQKSEDMLRDAIVYDALAIDRALFLGIERGRIVLEILDQRSGFWPFVKDLGLAFVNLATAIHDGPFK